MGVDVTSVDISPNNCPLGQELTVKLAFTPSQTVTGHWELKYMVDMASKRAIIELAKTSEATYAGGAAAEVTLRAPEIDISGFKPQQLANTGLVLACLMSGETEVLQVSMVTQVIQKGAEFTRIVFSPLE